MFHNLISCLTSRLGVPSQFMYVYASREVWTIDWSSINITSAVSEYLEQGLDDLFDKRSAVRPFGRSLQETSRKARLD